MMKIKERVESSSISRSRPYMRWDSSRNTYNNEGN